MLTREQSQGTPPAQNACPAAFSPDTETVGQKCEHVAYQRSGRLGPSTSWHRASRQGHRPPGALSNSTAEYLDWGRRQSEEQQCHIQHQPATHCWHEHSMPAQPPPYASNDWPQGQPQPYLLNQPGLPGAHYIAASSVMPVLPGAAWQYGSPAVPGHSMERPAFVVCQGWAPMHAVQPFMQLPGAPMLPVPVPSTLLAPPYSGLRGGTWHGSSMPSALPSASPFGWGPQQGPSPAAQGQCHPTQPSWGQHLAFGQQLLEQAQPAQPRRGYQGRGRPLHSELRTGSVNEAPPEEKSSLDMPAAQQPMPLYTFAGHRVVQPQQLPPSLQSVVPEKLGSPRSQDVASQGREDTQGRLQVRQQDSPTGAVLSIARAPAYVVVTPMAEKSNLAPQAGRPTTKERRDVGRYDDQAQQASMTGRGRQGWQTGSRCEQRGVTPIIVTASRVSLEAAAAEGPQPLREVVAKMPWASAAPKPTQAEPALEQPDTAKCGAWSAVPAWGKEWKEQDSNPKSPDYQQGYYLQGFWTSDQSEAGHFSFGKNGALVAADELGSPRGPPLETPGSSGRRNVDLSEEKSCSETVCSRSGEASSTVKESHASSRQPSNRASAPPNKGPCTSTFLQPATLPAAAQGKQDPGCTPWGQPEALHAAQGRPGSDRVLQGVSRVSQQRLAERGKSTLAEQSFPGDSQRALHSSSIAASRRLGSWAPIFAEPTGRPQTPAGIESMDLGIGSTGWSRGASWGAVYVEVPPMVAAADPVSGSAQAWDGGQPGIRGTLWGLGAAMERPCSRGASWDALAVEGEAGCHGWPQHHSGGGSWTPAFEGLAGAQHSGRADAVQGDASPYEPIADWREVELRPMLTKPGKDQFLQRWLQEVLDVKGQWELVARSDVAGHIVDAEPHAHRPLPQIRRDRPPFPGGRGARRPQRA